MNSLDEQYGYDANFISDVWESLKCGVCHLVMRQPVQIMSCGHRFCKPCFERLQGYSTHLNTQLRCPIDRDQIDVDKVFDDTAVSRDIGNLQVTCSYVVFGCSWKGDLRNLRDHEKECQHQINQNMQNRNQNENTENMNLVAELLRRVQSCENTLNGKEKDLAQMKNDILEMKKKYDQKENEVTELNKLNEDIRREMNETKKVNEKLNECFEGKVEIFEKRNEKLETRLQSLEKLTKGETKIINGKLELFETQIKANDTTIIACKDLFVTQEQLEILVKSNDRLETRFESLETQTKGENESIAERRVQLQLLILASKMTFEELKESIESLKAFVKNQIELLETQINANRTTIKECKDKCASKKQLENFKTKITKKLKESDIMRQPQALTNVNFEAEITKSIDFPETQKEANEILLKEHKESFACKEELETFKEDITNEMEYLKTQIKANETTLKKHEESFASKEELERRYIEVDTTNSFMSTIFLKFETRLESMAKLHTTFRKDTIHHLENIENVMFCHDPYCKEKNYKFKWVMRNFQRNYDIGERVFSPIFHTSLQGYCFRLGVKWTGDDKEDLGLGLYICLNEDAPLEQDEEGRYDLDPFQIEYGLEIHRKDGRSKVLHVTYERMNDLREGCFTIQPNDNKAKHGCGCTMLHKWNWNDFVINDMMYITCTFRIY